MARTDTLSNFLTDVAEAIRNKKGTTNTIPARNFDSEIVSIEGGGGSSKYAPRWINFYNYKGSDLIPELSQLDTSNLTNMSYMFYGCSGLKTLDLSSFNTSNVTSMNYVFHNCSGLTILDLSNFNTSNVTSMSYMFYTCVNLKTLDLSSFNTSNVTNTTYMFYNCSGLTSLDLSNFNTSNVTSMDNMFNSCLKLETVPELNCGKILSLSSMFARATVLKNLGGLINLGQAYLTTRAANYSSYKLDLSNCTSLTHDSLMNVINNLYDIAAKGCNTQQLVLGTTNLEKLTADEIAIATNKGWTVS